MCPLISAQFNKTLPIRQKHIWCQMLLSPRTQDEIEMRCTHLKAFIREMDKMLIPLVVSTQKCVRNKSTAK